DNEIRSIELLVDEAKAGDATLGIPRPDVARDHPDLTGAGKSGFVFQKELGRTFEGYHRLTVIIRSIGGTIRRTELPLLAASPTGAAASVDDPTIKLVVDLPRIEGARVPETIRRNLQIEGWALTPDGVASIDVSIDS